MCYEVKIRFQGHVSWVEVHANNASQAKALVQQQYGYEVTVLSCVVAFRQNNLIIRIKE